MNLTRYKLLFLGIALAVIGIALHLLKVELSDLIFGIGLLIALSAAFMFTYKEKEE